MSPSVSATPLIMLTTCAQDSLESLFGSLRYSVGGGSALSHYKVDETGIGRVQEQREVQKKITERTKRSRNTQDPDAYEGAPDPHRVQKKLGNM